MDSSGRPAPLAAGLVEQVAAQAATADRTRTVAPEVIAAIKGSGLLAFSATAELGGAEASITAMAAELELLATACPSTAWCVWNHLCVFHLFCGALGPEHADLLGGIVEINECRDQIIVRVREIRHILVPFDHRTHFRRLHIELRISTASRSGSFGS